QKTNQYIKWNIPKQVQELEFWGRGYFLAVEAHKSQHA
ncbi:MAG: hypothetical protein ACI8RA_002716, partial [Chlamydiales bacterium]